jgi:acetyl-CoA carboxylase carboxyl transferase subunit alpha
VVDEVVKEPVGGAHRNPAQAIAALGESLDRHLRDLVGQEPGALREARRRKFLEMGSSGL